MIADDFACAHRSFRRGHKVVLLVNPGDEDAHLSRLRCEGFDTESAQVSGQLELRRNIDAYLRERRFDQNWMVTEFEGLAGGNAPGGFLFSRIVCQMDWAGDVRPKVTDLIAFDARIIDRLDQYDHTGLLNARIEPEVRR
ncbi:MEDS domain-containing protein [Rhizobium leucaenae]|uniref:MEDS domain-containing protein n=1 Tax=Rhizobium leucaenae TaxID=29450 RepID=A0A7W7A0B2_9HYPH|nr:MEDS domain-containing protein [Rhizobium leucaenae]MBB4571420.1 hypothetical protein [Rhizobium leucaenae]MBB6305501.1 hypothetical protein [Rhizobium leucaenae]